MVKPAAAYKNPARSTSKTRVFACLIQLAWLARLRTLRGWALGLGLVTMVVAMTASGVVSMGNPKTWSGAYSAMAAAGMLRWAALPFAMLGAALLALAVVLHIDVRSHSRRLPGLCIDDAEK